MTFLTLTYILSLTLTKAPKCKYLHFTGRGTKAQNQVTCPIPHINYIGVWKASIQYEICYNKMFAIATKHDAFGNSKLPNVCSGQAKLEILGLNRKWNCEVKQKPRHLLKKTTHARKSTQFPSNQWKLIAKGKVLPLKDALCPQEVWPVGFLK